MLRQKKIKLLSLVVPSYKQEKTIISNIRNLQKALDSLPYKYELIIVIDGITDNTHTLIKKKIKTRRVKVLSYEKNRGKGYAVKYGMLRAKGDVIGFIDAGMDIDPAGITMLVNHMLWYDADIVIGSKLHPVSQVDYPFYRKVLSWGYRTFIRILFGLKIRDSQVGLKLFRRKVVRAVLPKILVKKFAFDIEILAVAYSFGYKRIFEGPIRLQFNHRSTITSDNFWKEIFSMIWDTSAVFYRLKILRYYKKR